MKKRWFFFVIFYISILLPSYSYSANDFNYTPSFKQQRISAAHALVLTKYHYGRLSLDNELSERVYSLYLRSLDPQKIYFLQADIDEFSRYRHQFDDYLKKASLNVPFVIYRKLIDRIHERTLFAEEYIESGEFDFTSDKTILLDRKNEPYAINNDVLNTIWQERLQSELISLLVADKDRTIEEAKERLSKRYKVRSERISQNTNDDIFELFMNVVSRSFDPHSAYYSAKQMEDFNIGMSLSLQGIGTVLSQDEDAIKIMEVIPGGPADLTGQIQVADELIGVAQGETGEFVDIAGLRLDKVVEKIRGKKGTVVRLQILGDKGKGAEKTVRIVRDTVQLEKQAAKSEIKKVPSSTKEEEDYRIGVITLPTFYSDFEGNFKGEKDYRSTTRDVKKLLKEMEEEGELQGLVIDLRNNGGGSLQEVIDLSSIFLEDPHRTIVQTRDYDGRITLQRSPNDEQLFKGPLLVMVNRLSASASEIFAGSMQDQGRAIIAGSTTFGKGTVQTMLKLDSLLSKTEKPGQSRVTIATFYRASGETTQEKGVTPDILFPSLYDPAEIGESKEQYVIPWDQITPAPDYQIPRIPYLTKLKTLSQKRFEADKAAIIFSEQAQALYEQWENKMVSLNLEKRWEEMKEREDDVLTRENELRELYGYSPLTLEEYKNEDGSYTKMLEETEVDFLLDEATFVLRDFIDLKHEVQ